MAFVIDLDAYRGPIDLLIYLVRRDELDINKVSLARVTQQFIDYLEFLRELDLDDIAEFIEIASILIEMKSKSILPQQSEEKSASEVAVEPEPADQLVERLLEYKRIRDAASVMEEQSRRWQLRFPRVANDLPTRRVDPSEQPIADLEIWDLVSAFGRVLRENQPVPPANVVYDETPIHVYMKRLHESIRTEGRVELSTLFKPGMHKSAVVGMFLATLELTRHHGLETHQEGPLTALYLSAGSGFPEQLEVAEVDGLKANSVARSNMPVLPR